jgi:hypothetical protein
LCNLSGKLILYPESMPQADIPAELIELTASLYCECRHKIGCRVRREGKRLVTLAYFTAEEINQMYAEQAIRCLRCDKQLRSNILC